MNVSIVIPHYGDSALTVACLAHIAVHTPKGVEVVVVDNGTGDRFPADVRINNPENRGFAMACNQGAAAAAHDMVCFLNNDTEPQAGWLPPLVDALGPDVAAVGARLVYPDGRLQHAGIWLYRTSSDVLVAENRLEEHPAGDAEAVTAACMLVDRPKFFAAGGFDEGYFNGYEDVDLCLTLRERGWRVVYQPASTVIHHESASGPARWVAVRENIARLQNKWAWTSTVAGGTNG
jgi:GT2 family glycosyltransferase